MKKKKPSIKEQFEEASKNLRQSYERWEKIYHEGGEDPFYADGCGLNLKRNHILFYKKELDRMVNEDNQKEDLNKTERLQYPKEYYFDVPQEMPLDYLADKEGIVKEAKKRISEIFQLDSLFLSYELSKQTEFQGAGIGKLFWTVKTIQKAVNNPEEMQVEDYLLLRRENKAFQDGYLNFMDSLFQKDMEEYKKHIEQTGKDETENTKDDEDIPFEEIEAWKIAICFLDDPRIIDLLDDFVEKEKVEKGKKKAKILVKEMLETK